MTRRTLLSAAWVIGHGDGRYVVHENGVVVIEGAQVLHVGRDFDGEVAERIDYGAAVIAPGFIDLDALSDLDTTILGFDNGASWKTGRVWPESYVARGPSEMYSEEELAFQKRFAFAQLIRNGINTALPIASLFYLEWGETVAEFDAAAAAAEELGLRVYLGPAYRTGGQVTDGAGNIRAIYDEARGLRGLQEAAEFAARIDGSADGRIRAMFAPDRIETCTEKLLRRTHAIAAEMGAPIRQHCCQSPTELRLVEEQHGTTPIAWLDRIGTLGPNWLLPHGTHASDRDFELMAQHGATLVHCPLVSARHGSLLQTLMTSTSGRDVRDVWIDGRRVMADRVIPGIDATAGMARAQAQFDGLIAKYPYRTAGHPPVEAIFTPNYLRAS